MKRTCAVLLLSWSCVCCTERPTDYTIDFDAVAPLTVTEELRIGDADDPEVGFSMLAAAEVDERGRVYAFDYMERKIRVYDANGTLLRRIGGPGSGPGEFEGGPRFGVRGDTLWTFDMAARRITLFDTAGAVLGTSPTEGVRVPTRGGFAYIFPWRMRPDGRFTGWMMRLSYNRKDAQSPVTESDSIPLPIVTFDLAGDVADTIGSLPHPEPRMVVPVGYDRNRFRVKQVGDQRYMIPDPPPELPTWHALDDGYFSVSTPFASSADSARFTITRIALNRDTTFVRTFRYRPAEYTSADLDSVAAREARNGPPRSPAEQKVAQNVMRAEMQFPRYKQPITHPWLDQQDGLWLARADEPGPRARFVVLDSTGLPLGQVELPGRSRPLWHRAGVLYVAELDGDDVPWLVRYRIELAAR